MGRQASSFLYICGVRRAAFAVGLLAIAIGTAAWLLDRLPAAAGGGEPAAILSVLTGTAQLTRAGASVAVAARGGDQVRVGDRVATGPGTRAVLRYVDGDETRLDSGTALVVSRADRTGSEVVQLGGRTWNRVLAGGTSLAVTSGGRHERGDRLGSVFAVPNPEAGSTADPWTALNRAFDLLPPGTEPGAIGSGSLLPGEESTIQQAVSVSAVAGASDLLFSAGWTAGDLELVVIDPAGNVRERLAGGTSPLSLRVARAGVGWQYRLRDLDSTGPAGTWFVLTTVVAL